jgi:hypothetical protein
MPTTFEFVFAPEDEKQFLTFLKQFELTAYPNRVPPGFEGIPVSPDALPQLTEEGYYLAAEKIAPVEVRTIKRGKDAGYLEIDEVNCPVMHYDRSLFDEDGQLRSGKLWSELNLTGDIQRNPAFPESYRRILLQIREWLRTKTHKSSPSGFHIGPQAARLAKEGTTLREMGRKGGVLKPYK